jgi:hypothetical protein
VFLVLIDSSFAFELPKVSTGWVETIDVETGRRRTVSRATLADLADRARDYQEELRGIAREAGLDVVQVGLDHTKADIALGEFVAERRLRKTYS